MGRLPEAKEREDDNPEPVAVVLGQLAAQQYGADHDDGHHAVRHPEFEGEHPSDKRAEHGAVAEADGFFFVVGFAVVHAWARLSGSTDKRIPTVLSTANKVFNVGLPLGESVRYKDSRLIPASAATVPRPP